MSTKKKTVKELNDLVDSLVEKVKDLEEKGKSCIRNHACSEGTTETEKDLTEFEERLTETNK
jgi:hypothetical protein